MKGRLLTILVVLLVALSVRTVIAFDFADPSDDYLVIIDNYHSEVNEFFNLKFEGLREILAEENFLKDEELRAQLMIPATINDLKDSYESALAKCKAKANFSSYCVSLEATEMYSAYVSTLEANRGALIARSLGSAEGQLEEVQNRSQFIEEEKERSLTVLKRTLAVYNEFTLAYPMHEKYQEIYEGLVLYRQLIKDIRLETDWFEGKFIDASSPYCI